MAFLAGAGTHDVRHQEADLRRREELARALARAFRELPQQVLVGAPEEIGLHVGEAQPVARVGEGLDHLAQLGRIDVALAVPLSGEVDHVDDAGQGRVLPHNRSHRFGQVLTDVLRARGAALVIVGPLIGLPTADYGPSRLGRQIEPEEFVVFLGDLEGGVPVAVLLRKARNLVVEHVGQSLQEEQRQKVVLELGCVLLAPDRAGGIPEHLLHGLRRRCG